MFLAVLTSAGRQTCFGIAAMELKIFAMMLLVGFLSALYHAGKPRDSREPEQVEAPGHGPMAAIDLPAPASSAAQTIIHVG